MAGLNTFAHVGDTSVSEGLDGEKFERHSEFDIKLREKIDYDPHFEFYYTTEAIPEDTVAFMEGDHWVFDVDDYSKVTAVKFVLKDTVSIEPGEKVSFIMNAKAPLDNSLDDGQHANGSLGVSTDGKRFNESNLAMFELVRYSVSGNIFDDFNEDSIKGSEQDLENVIVKLYGASGVIETHTDEHGNYSFELDDEGEYFIDVELQDDYNFSEISNNNDGSQVDPNTGRSKKFKLDIDNRDAVLNVGMFKDETQLVIDNIALKSNGDKIEDTHTFDFMINVDNAPYNGVLKVNGKAKVIRDGKVRLSQKDLGRIEISNLDKEVSYEVIMDEHNLFTTTPDLVINGVIENYVTELTYVNTIDQKDTDLVTEKTWINGPSVKETINIVLKRDGEIIKEESLTDGNTVIEWGNHPLRDVDGRDFVYTVDEVNVPEHYIKVVQGMNIANTYVVETMNLEVRKQWVGKSLDEVKFDLFKNDEKINTFTLSKDKDWTLEIKDLDKTDINGKLIEYRVVEHDYVGYLSEVIQEGNSFVITNTQVLPEEPGEGQQPDEETPKEELPKDEETPKNEDPKVDIPSSGDKEDNSNTEKTGGERLPSTGVSSMPIIMAFGLVCLGFILKRKSIVEKS